MSASRVGRNDPCPCGSTKKFKKCCLVTADRVAEYANVVDICRLGHALKATGRPQLSTPYKGKRVRAVGSRIYIRPEKETFHEFLIAILAEVFGGEWYEAELKRSLEERHIVAQWYFHFRAWQKKNVSAENAVQGGWVATTDGPTQAIMELAYDLYLLQHCSSLPKGVVKRLRDRVAFQGIRYEVVVAAIFARLGYAIEWEDEKQTARHCEFIAENPRTGDLIGVEAKSRRRSGVLHEPVKYEGPVKMRGDIGGLLDKALTQKPLGTSFIIFVDLNLPATAQQEFKDKPWMADVKAVIEKLPTPTPEAPDVVNAIIVTNFSSHYGAPGVDAPPSEYLMIASKFPKDALKNATALTEIGGVLQDHNQIHDQERGATPGAMRG